MFKELRDPDPAIEAAAGGGGTEGNKPAAAPSPDLAAINKMTDPNPVKVEPTINFDTAVKVDGKDVKIADLVQAQKKATETEAELKALRDFWNPNAQLNEQHEVTLRRVMADAGYSHDDIEKEVSRVMGHADPDANQPPAKTGGAETQRANAAADNAVKELLRAQFRTSTERALDTNPDAAAILKFVEERDGADAAKQVKQSWLDMASQARDNRLSALTRERGAQRFEMAWVDPASAEAVNDVVGKARALLGDPKELGRVPSLTAGETRGSFRLPEKPVEMPKGTKEGASEQDVLEGGGKHMVDRLSRIAAEVVASKGDGVV